MAPQLIADILKRWKACKAQRDTLTATWEEMADLYQPSQAGFSGDRALGDSRSSYVFDGHQIISAGRCATAIEAELVPADVKWLAIGTVDEIEADDDEATEWLDDVARVTHDRIYDAESGFQSATSQVFANLVTFGAGPCYAGASRDGLGFSFRAEHLRDVHWWRDTNGLPQTVYASSKLRAQQVADRYTAGALSAETQRLLTSADGQDKRIEVLEVVTPRYQRTVGSPHALDMPWAVYVIEVAAEHMIAESGETSMPWIIPEWQVLPNGDIWSLARAALPDVRQLQAMAKTMIEASQFAVRPPLAMPGGILQGTAKLVPGGMTLFDPVAAGRWGQGGLVQQLGVIGQIPIGVELMQALYDRIDRFFLLDVLQLPDKHGMTATEVLRLNADLVRLTSSPFGRFDTGFVRPLVERCFNALMQASIELRFGPGAPFKPPPQSLQQQKIKFKFMSPASRARKFAETAQLATFVESLMPAFQVNAEMADNFDWDAIAREYCAQALSPKFLVPVQERDAKRKATQDAAAQNAQMAQLEQGASAAGKATPFLQAMAGQLGQAKRIGAAA